MKQVFRLRLIRDLGINKLFMLAEIQLSVPGGNLEFGLTGENSVYSTPAQSVSVVQAVSPVFPPTQSSHPSKYAVPPHAPKQSFVQSFRGEASQVPQLSAVAAPLG